MSPTVRAQNPAARPSSTPSSAPGGTPPGARGAGTAARSPWRPGPPLLGVLAGWIALFAWSGLVVEPLDFLMPTLFIGVLMALAGSGLHSSRVRWRPCRRAARWPDHALRRAVGSTGCGSSRGPDHRPGTRSRREKHPRRAFVESTPTGRAFRDPGRFRLRAGCRCCPPSPRSGQSVNVRVQKTSDPARPLLSQRVFEIVGEAVRAGLSCSGPRAAGGAAPLPCRAAKLTSEEISARPERSRGAHARANALEFARDEGIYSFPPAQLPPSSTPSP